MFTKTLALIGFLGVAAAQLRGESELEHLELEVEVNGERQLFPLLPGTKCPPGHVCHARTFESAVQNPSAFSPIVNSMKNSMKTRLAATLNWEELNNNLEAVVVSDDYCTRRAAMARAAGLAAGASLAAVSQPAFAAQTVEVKMGADSGLLVFVPQKISICAGDTVKWINNKAGPHNVVFDEDAIPAGVEQEKISMDDQLGEEGETFSMKFDVAGKYEYYCEPHRGAGMQGFMTVA